MQRIVVGVEQGSDGAWTAMSDWETVVRLNRLVEHPDRATMRRDSSEAISIGPEVLSEAQAAVEAWLETQQVPFARPTVSLSLVLWRG